MRVMIVGGGGREHAILNSIKNNSKISKIFALPGNGGMAKDAQCVDIKANDIAGITKFAVDNSIDFAIVAPDDPLVLGAVDSLEAEHILCFGPRANAAIIEGSKIFSKNLMKKYDIPTAEYEAFSNLEQAIAYVKTAKMPTVVKADGLALGKGVVICENVDEAITALNQMMGDKVFGESGANVVVEEFIEGPEVSVLAFTDGKTIVPMVSAMDHKRIGDNDQGLNTGGMGTIAPNPFFTTDIADICMKTIFEPTIAAMTAEGRTFKGCLFFGLMITKDGPKVIEYNCRFGDPETQVVLPLLKTNLFDIMLKVATGTLSEEDVKFSTKAACCVIMASNGYPQKYQTGFDIKIRGSKKNVFIAGAKKDGKKLKTAGGRVLGVTAIGSNLESAIKNAYKKVTKVSFENAYFRKDIGKKALEKGDN